MHIFHIYLVLDVSLLVHHSRPASHNTYSNGVLDDGLKLCIVVTQQQSHWGCVHLHANHCPVSFTTIAAALCGLCVGLCGLCSEICLFFFSFILRKLLIFLFIYPIILSIFLLKTHLQ